ncbi:MAG: BF3164 family lipoprotein [Bacteroidales bacterium]|nr:BF3164 family lipoprotein [Bacteroidales bacterium]
MKINTNPSSRVLICIAIFFLLVSCDHYNSEKEFNNTYLIKGKDLNISNKIKRPISFKIIDNYLIFKDNQKGKELTIFDLNDFSKQYYLGKTGEGPGEIINAGPLSSGKHSFYLFDYGKRILSKFLTDSLDREDYKGEEIFKNNEYTYTDVALINDTCYLAVGVFPDFRFRLIDSHGNVFLKDIEYPIENTEKKLFHIRGMAYLSIIRAHPKQPRFAAADRYGGSLSVYNIDFQSFSISKINGFDLFFPQFETYNYNGTPNFKPNESTRWGYLSLSVTDERIYALYSGKNQKKGISYQQGNIIHVFNWEGNPLYRLTLDKEVRHIDVDSSRKTLYALYENNIGDFEVAQYALPDKLNQSLPLNTLL